MQLFCVRMEMSWWMWLTYHSQSKCLGCYFSQAWISSNPFVQPEKESHHCLKKNPSLHFTGRVAVSPPEHTVIYSLPHSHQRHKPLRRDCRQHSCQHTRCHSITPHKHPAFTLFVFPPVQAATAHKHREGLIYIYNKSPSFIPCSGKEPWHKCNLLTERRNSSKKNQAHVAFCRQRGAATCKHVHNPTHAGKHGRSPTYASIHTYALPPVFSHIRLNYSIYHPL